MSKGKEMKIKEEERNKRKTKREKVCYISSILKIKTKPRESKPY